MPKEPQECPLCGGLPEIEDRSKSNGAYWICTHRCEAVPTLNFYVEMSADFESKDAAVTAWNAWLEAMKK